MRSDSLPWRLGGFGDGLAQFLEAFDGKLDQQRFVIGKMPVGRGMADAGLARHRPQRQGRERFLFQDGARRIQKTVAQIAVMIAAWPLRRGSSPPAQLAESRSLALIRKPL